MRQETEMNVRQMVFSIPETLQATLAFPEPPTPEVLRVLEGVSTLVCRAIGAAAGVPRALETGEIEYRSWGRASDANEARRALRSGALDAGEAEYASWWPTSDRGEIEYASWFADPRAAR